MKNVIRLFAVVLLVVLVLPLVPVSAQDGGEGEGLVASEATAVYFQTATAGSLADNGDGTYTLTLQGVGAQVAWIMSAPSMAIQQQSNVNLAKQWAAAEGLSTGAVLQVGDLNIQLTLTAPAYDEATSTETYVATVGEIAAPEGVKEPELPTSFDAASLSVAWSIEFQNGLVDGVTAMYEGMRATPEECAAAKQQWADFQTWWNAKSTEYNAAVKLCLAGDSAQCTTAKSIAAERSAKYASMQWLPTYINANCK